MSQLIDYLLFTDGARRPVFKENGRQFVHNDDNDWVYGVWFMLREERDEPVVFESIARAAGMQWFG